MTKIMMSFKFKHLGNIKLYIKYLTTYRAEIYKKNYNNVSFTVKDFLLLLFLYTTILQTALSYPRCFINMNVITHQQFQFLNVTEGPERNNWL